jgi:diguanylate cyclase (GGDEF)-like protein/PAS domain S-box-containing protein
MTQALLPVDNAIGAPHPRTMGWVGTTALAMGGSNQSLFLIGALIAGQDGIPGQGSAAIPLLILGLLLSWAAAFGWTELVLMWPNRVGGIAATCAEAFRPINPVLANLTGVCYWWGWVPTCGLTALLSASAIHQWYLPHVPAPLLACALVLFFMGVNLCGVRCVTRLVIPIATASAALAFLSALIPIVTGHVNWHQATTFHLITPFGGIFGKVTSAMTGLYLVGFAAPAFEAAACHVGEIVDPHRNVPRAMFTSAAMATVYFVLLPIVWLGVFGPAALADDLQNVLGPTFAPLFGSAAKAAAIWFMMLNMFHGTLAPLAGAARTLSQLSEDGLLPRILARRSRTDCPWVATVLTAAMSIAFLLAGDPIWVIAAANLTYLISICMPSIAVWLLRRDAPDMVRPYRAPRGTIQLGLLAAFVWAVSAVLGFQQFGLPTVLFGLALAYSGTLLYAWRRWSDRKRTGERKVLWSLHTKLTGAMLLVLTLDGAGYLLAVKQVNSHQIMLIAILQDIFVAVALLTIAVGLVLPGMVAHAAEEVARSAHRLANGTLADFSRAMQALGRGDLESALARLDNTPLVVRSRDEMGLMTENFNIMQAEVARAAQGLTDAREGLRQSRHDLTAANLQLEQQMEELSQSRERFELAVLGSKDGIWDWNIQANEVYFSPRYKHMLGLEEEEMENRLEEWQKRIHSEDINQTLACLQGYLAGSIGEYEIEFRMLRKDGSYGWILSRGVALRDADGTPYRMTGSHTDITGRKQAEHLLEYQAHHDVLTGLPNRILLRDRMAQALLQAERDHTQVALLVMDVDRFKEINDTFGHHYGDLLLQQLKPRLHGAVRASDTVARLGGDEFACILLETNEADAQAAAHRILSSLERPFVLEENSLNVEMSIGIALYPDHGVEFNALMRRADVAMYVAKQSGSRSAVYNLAQDNYTEKRLTLIGDLRRALDTDEFVLHYQPQVELRSGEVTSVEALVRWQHPQYGFLPPGEFVPLAEQTGLIAPLSLWVLNTALRQLRLWQQMGFDIHMAVNLSARNVHDAALPETIGRMLHAHQVAPGALLLEITESAVMENPEEAISNLKELRDMGVRLSIDDFGTGFSSLTYLKRMPVHEVKIDRSFVMDMATNDEDAKIVRSIVDLGRNLGLAVVAEGVENQAAYDLLVATGCHMAQGYFISRPLPTTALTSWLSERLSLLQEAA